VCGSRQMRGNPFGKHMSSICADAGHILFEDQNVTKMQRKFRNA
jgi:hypothetical protein